MGVGFWQSPEVQGGAIPFGAALLLCLMVRLAGGREHGARLAVVAVPLGFLLAYILLEPVAWPAVASKQKVFYIALLALVIGLAAAVRGARRSTAVAAAAIFAVASLIWLAIRRLSGEPGFGDLATLVVLLLVSIVLVWRLLAAEAATPDEPDESRGSIHAPAMLLLLAFAAGLISLAGAFIGMAQLAIALGAVLGGFLLVSYVSYVRSGQALRFGPLGALAAGGAWLACLYVMVLFAGAVSRPALAILLVAFLADPLARRIRFSQGKTARMIEPILYGAIVALPAIAGVVYAFSMADSEPGY